MDHMLTRAEVRARLRIGPRTLQGLIEGIDRNGRPIPGDPLPEIRISARRRWIRESDLDAWLATRNGVVQAT